MRAGSSFPPRAGHSLAGATILQIIPALDVGGAERTTLDIAGALAEAGAKALVATDGGRLVSELQAKGGLWIPFPARTKNPLAMALNVRRLRRLIVQEAVDIVHVRSRAPAWVAYGATRGTKTPLVTTYHGAYAGKSALKRRYNSVMAAGDRVIANSRFTAEAIASQFPTTAGRVTVIPRGIDFRQFATAAVTPARVQALRQEWGVAPDERIVLMAARLAASKGHKTLIEAAGHLMRGGLRGTKFVLAGDDQGRSAYAREIDRDIARADLKGIVVRAGHCADMPAAMMAAAVVAVPSTQAEAFGRVAVEAQAVGTPVVVSDLGAAAETVIAPPDGDPAQRTGWRVEANRPEAFAMALREALDLGASAREAMSRRARQHVEANFSVDRMCAETLSIYASLLFANEMS